MTAGNSDPFNLQRFLDAQRTTFDDAISELTRGRKTSHWMWFVFPQITGLGRSDMAQLYAISSREEALAYLAHPVLGQRLRQCVAALLSTSGRSAHEIMGSPDDVKLKSCLTLFAAVAPEEPLFGEALDRFFNGEADEATIERL